MRHTILILIIFPMFFSCNNCECDSDIDACDVVYLDSNGVTIKAYPCAEIGDVGVIEGIEYTVVDRSMLDDMLGPLGTSTNEDFTKVCTTRVTDMSNLFLCHEDFNQPIGNWDVSNVTNMSWMFANECNQFHQFNQSLIYWNVSNVTDMSYMFGMAFNFDQNISSWDVSSVTNMSGMFSRAEAFNHNISSWDVSNVTDMSWMFYGVNSYNQSILGWDTSLVTNMSHMFSNATSFNQDSNNINTGSVIDWNNFCLKAVSWTLPKPNFSNCGDIGCD